MATSKALGCVSPSLVAREEFLKVVLARMAMVVLGVSPIGRVSVRVNRERERNEKLREESSRVWETRCHEARKEKRV